MADNKDEAQGDIILTDESEKKPSDAYGNLSRGLTGEELAQTGTQKLILNDLAKAESLVKKLEPYRDKYYSVLSDKNVLEEKLKKTKRAEVLYTFCVTSGGIIVGISKIFLEKDLGLSIIMFAIGLLLILGGVLFKVGFKD